MAFLFGSPALCRVCRYKESVIILGGLMAHPINQGENSLIL